MDDRAAVKDRHGYWFPLALLGFGLLGLLGWDSMAPTEDFGWVAYAPLSSDPGYAVSGESVQLSVYHNALPQPGMVVRSPRRDAPWAVLATATLVITVAWYAWCARRAGGSVRAHAALAVAGGIAVPLCYVAAAIADAIAAPAGLVPSAGLPLVGLGLLAGAWAYFRLGPWRRTAAAVGVVCLAAGVGTVLGAWMPGLLTPVLIAGGLLALARFERSRPLAIVACAVLAALVVFPDGTLSTLIPAVIVLAATIVTLVRRSGAGTPA